MTKIAKSPSSASPPSIGTQQVRVVFTDKKNTFFILAKQDNIQQWKKDKSVPLVDVVDSFDIYETETGGLSGKAAHPSKQDLANAFGSTDPMIIIPKLLENGKCVAVNGKLMQSNATSHHA